ncbi:MAG TPA: STAS domain-containing protein [Streptosporangiaceae bacterium]|nr:STAS domain-containing protein [Streptosporangiaceae bacterium]
MSDERLPVLWLSQSAVVSLPAEIDLSNADQVREELLAVLNRSPDALIVDMGGTTFCDSACVNALARAHKRAAESGAGMRLVVTASGVQRVLAITGIDGLMGIYPSVAEALTGSGGRADQAPDADTGHPAAPDGPRGWAAQPG